MDINIDKRYFLSQLKTNPFFFLRHFKSLSSIFLEKYSYRYFIKPKDPHRGNKKKPSWIKNSTIKNHSAYKDFTTLLQRIPYREVKLLMVCHTATREEFIETNDPEDYLAIHRWSLLIDDLFEHSNNLFLSWQLPVNIIERLSKSKEDPAWETYSTCERICNLLTWISFIPREERFLVLPNTVIEFLEESMQWVLAHIEYYGKKTNNHILNNARCLIMAGTVLSNEKAVITGKNILHDMLNKLIKPHGSLRERSNHYQLLISTWLLDSYYFLKSSELSDKSFLSTLENTIKKMLNVAALTCNKYGSMQVYIGDISPDLSPEKIIKRLLLCYPDFWPQSNSEICSRDDWRVLKNNTNQIIVNCPEGKYPLDYPSHSHNDITSFVWLHNETPILVDSGRARYTKDLISSQQKSGLGHSVPFVNGFPPVCESLIYHGNWQPVPYAKTHIKILENPHSIKIYHDGYKRATPVHSHERMIYLKDDSIEITDSFEGHGAVDIRLYWHFHPLFSDFDISRYCIKSHDYKVFLTPTKNVHNIKFEKMHQSTQYGFIATGSAIIIDYKVQLPVKILTLFKVFSCAE